MDHQVWDAYWRVERAVSSGTDNPWPVVMIDIDEPSLQVAPWPWPRSLLAELVKSIDRQKPASIGLDMVFPEPADVDGDRMLMLLGQEKKIIFSQVFDFDGHAPVGHLAGGIPITEKKPALNVAQAWLSNHDGLANMPCVGHISYLAGSDGVIRQVPLLIAAGEQMYSNLAMQLWTCPLASIRYQRPSLDQLTLSTVGKQLSIPVNKWAQARIPYAQSWANIPTYSAMAVLTHQLPKDALQGRYVLVGSSAVGLNDRVSTPLDGLVPGVAIHALLINDWINHPTEPIYFFNALPWLFGALFLIMMVFGLERWSAPQAMVYWLLTLSVWVALSVCGHWQRVEAAYAIPWLMALAFLGQALMEWAFAQVKKRRLLVDLSHYLPEKVVRALDREQHAAAKSQLITVMFVDIENYSQLSEQLAVEELTTVTREILALLTQSVLRHRGLLDKYIGDALLAIWHAEENHHHVNDALNASQEMLRAMREYNASRTGSSIQIRIGINTGEAIVGELGTDYRRAYTAVGLTVNLAQRLQELAGEWQVGVAIGESCLSYTQQSLTLLTEVTPRGFSKKQKIYTYANGQAV